MSTVLFTVCMRALVKNINACSNKEDDKRSLPISVLHSHPGALPKSMIHPLCARSKVGSEAFKGWTRQKGGGRRRASSWVRARLWCNCGWWQCRSQFRRRYPQTTSAPPNAFLSPSPFPLLCSIFFTLVPFIPSTPISHKKAPTTLLYPHAGSNIICSFLLSLFLLSAQPCITASALHPTQQHPSSTLRLQHLHTCCPHTHTQNISC